MKVRAGFVSNSSSSSFVIFGIVLSDELKAKYYNSDQDDSETPSAPTPPKTICINDDSDVYMGWKIAGGDDCDFSVADVTLEELQDYAKKFEKMVGIKPTLFGGMRLA